MIMPNFLHVFNAYTSQSYINIIYKGITGDIQKVAQASPYNNAAGVFADSLWRLAPTGDFTTDTFYYGSMVFVGNGTTAPTIDDYNLESLIGYSAKGLHMESTSLAYNENTDHYKINRIMTVVLRNKSENDINVSEMGWFIAVPTPDDNSSEENRNYYRMMLAREVFEPVTIKPGEVRAFTMSIEM